jgi:hypothetical protein
MDSGGLLRSLTVNRRRPGRVCLWPVLLAQWKYSAMDTLPKVRATAPGTGSIKIAVRRMTKHKGTTCGLVSQPLTRLD